MSAFYLDESFYLYKIFFFPRKWNHTVGERGEGGEILFFLLIFFFLEIDISRSGYKTAEKHMELVSGSLKFIINSEVFRFLVPRVLYDTQPVYIYITWAFVSKTISENFIEFGGLSWNVQENLTMGNYWDKKIYKFTNPPKSRFTFSIPFTLVSISIYPFNISSLFFFEIKWGYR